MKKSELRNIIREEYNSINEQDERVFKLSAKGGYIYRQIADLVKKELKNDPDLLAFYVDVIPDKHFNKDKEMVDTFLQDLGGNKLISKLMKSGLIEQSRPE